MRKRIFIIGLILLIFLGSIDKKMAESRAENHLADSSKSSMIDIKINEVWSDWKGPCYYEVFIDYRANNLVLVSMFEVEKWKVISGVRVSK